MAYIVIQDVRDEGIVAADVDDAKVQAYINTWQAMLERACRQWFESRALTLTLDGNDCDTLFLGVPIVSIDYIKLNSSTDALGATLYKVYSSRKYPDDRRNPRIKLVGPDEYRDIFVAPLLNGPLKFRKGRQNQEVKGNFGFIEDDVKAKGTIQFVAKASLNDSETFVLDDGVNPAVTFYFDESGTYTPPGGYDATNVRVNISGDTGADDVTVTAKAAINGATSLNITAGIVTTDNLLRLENDIGGYGGNQTITETVTDAGFAVVGMYGGGVPYLITRALTKLVIEKLTNPIYAGASSSLVPSTSTGQILSEKTDGHEIRYGGATSVRKSGLSGITDDMEILDIIKLYRAPIGLATPAGWSTG